MGGWEFEKTRKGGYFVRGSKREGKGLYQVKIQGGHGKKLSGGGKVGEKSFANTKNKRGINSSLIRISGEKLQSGREGWSYATGTENKGGNKRLYMTLSPLKGREWFRPEVS